MRTRAKSLANVAFGMSVAGFPLCLLSYSWLLVPAAGAEERVLNYVVVISECGALLAATVAIGLSLVVRRQFHGAAAERRRTLQALALGMLLLSLLIVPNILGALWARSG